MRGLVLSFLVAATAGPSALAHHGYSTFDQGQMMWLDGYVAEFQYGDPHPVFKIRDARGRVFDAEWQGVSHQSMVQVHPDTLKTGERIIVAGHPQRDPNIFRIHVRVVHRLSDGWHWPQCASVAGPFDCMLPTVNFGVTADGTVVPTRD